MISKTNAQSSKTAFPNSIRRDLLQAVAFVHKFSGICCVEPSD